MADDTDTVAHGEGPGIAVLLHAAGSSPRSLGSLARRLAPAAGRAVALAIEPDSRASADTRHVFQGTLGRVRSLLETAPAGQRVLVGHSMGGLVALLALVDGAPADVAILYEPIVLSLLDPDDEGDRAALAWDAAVIEAFSSAMSRGDTEAGVRAFIEAYGGHAWETLPPLARAELLSAAPRLHTQTMATNRARLSLHAPGRVRRPVLVIDGDRSPDITRRMADRIAALLPDAQRTTIVGAGHMGPQTAPAAVADVIGAFLSRTLAPG